MMASRVEVNFQEVIAVGVADDAVIEHRFLRPWSFVVIGKALVLLLVAHQIVCQRCLVLSRQVLHQCPIGLLYAARTEQLIQPGQGLAGTGENHHPADRAIQAMDHPQEDGAGLGVFLLAIRFHRLGEWSVASLVALDDFPSTLRDDDDMIVFVEDGHSPDYIFIPPSI